MTIVKLRGESQLLAPGACNKTSSSSAFPDQNKYR
jgi:hypothetical protein